MRRLLDAKASTVFSTDHEPSGKPAAPTGLETFKYTSEKHDEPTGLVHLRARQYDPDLGRFVSADPVLGSLSDPQTQNRFTYAVDNPLKYTDPSGQSSCNAEAADFLYRSCRLWEGYHAFTGAVYEYTVWHPRFLTFEENLEGVLMLLSLFPVVGIIGDLYFLGKSVYTGITTGEWDLWTIGLTAIGVAGVGAVGAVRAARVLRAAEDVAASLKVLANGRRVHKVLSEAFRLVFNNMGLEEDVSFFINKGIRYVDDAGMAVRGSGRPDIFLRLVGPGGTAFGLALDIKSALTVPSRYARQMLRYERAMAKAGYVIIRVTTWLY